MSTDPDATRPFKRVPTDPAVTLPPVADDGEGAATHALVRVFGRSYKTTIVGWLTLFAGVVPLLPDMPSGVVKAASVVTTLLIAAGFVAAKATGVTGTK